MKFSKSLFLTALLALVPLALVTCLSASPTPVSATHMSPDLGTIDTPASVPAVLHQLAPASPILAEAIVGGQMFTPKDNHSTFGLVLVVGVVALLGGVLVQRLRGNAAVFVLLFGIGVSTLWAADAVQRYFNSIIVTPGRTAVTGSNGFVRCYLPSGSNYVMLGTNGIPIIYCSVGTLTGFTGNTTWSNGNVLSTQSWFGGILVRTNGGTAPTP